MFSSNSKLLCRRAKVISCILPQGRISQTLFVFWWNLGNIAFLCHCSVFNEFRVDAFYKCAHAEVDPVEYAVLRSYDVEEALAVLKEFVQIPDQVKLEKLWRLMRFGASENPQQDFEEMLRSLPVDLVKMLSHSWFKNQAGEQYKCGWRVWWNSSADCDEIQERGVHSTLAGIWVGVLLVTFST